MKILLINPPNYTIGSRLAGEHLPPLGLLSIGGPLIDSGHSVKLMDADYKPMDYKDIVSETINYNPDFVLMGHSGSTTSQPSINKIAALIKNKIPQIKTIIGGVFPTYHWHEILETNTSIDFVVIGEGEKIITNLINALEKNIPLNQIKGIAYRNQNNPVKNTEEELIKNLDDYRIGWELMKGNHYTYWGQKKAVVMQFSRGCPFQCSYCGQRLFWKKWRHRSPKSIVDEIEMLVKNYGIEVINFADENPSANKEAWKEFLELLIEKNLNIILVGSIRADNVYRDSDILHLYKKAGFERLLLGIENYDEEVLKKINKKGSILKDKEAIQLLRKHGILSMATYVVGFTNETSKDFYNSLKQLISYDPDQIQVLYVTPHKWTPYYQELENNKIIQLDQKKWDYKHQVMETINLKPWRIFLYVKLIEVLLQTRPKSLKRLFFHKDKGLRAAMHWYTKIGRKVWFYEIYQFIFQDNRLKKGVPINLLWK